MEENNEIVKKKRWPYVIAVIIVVAIVFWFGRGFITGDVVGGAGGDSGKEVIIPLSEISENAKWYEYDGIRYFAVKANDGSIKTAFDACDVCYSSRKGYSQQGNVMVCNNCGNKYPISGLGTENLRGGGCWPGYLPNTIKEENLIIKVSDLKKGDYRF